MRLIAVTSRQRAEQLPQVPTVAASGLAGYEGEIWNVLPATVGTPAAAVQRLNAATNAALVEAGVRRQLAARGLVAAPMSVNEVARFVRNESKKWGTVVKRVGLRMG